MGQKLRECENMFVQACENHGTDSHCRIHNETELMRFLVQQQDESLRLRHMLPPQSGCPLYKTTHYQL
jgi:hypothetical protein